MADVGVFNADDHLPPKYRVYYLADSITNTSQINRYKYTLRQLADRIHAYNTPDKMTGYFVRGDCSYRNDASMKTVEWLVLDGDGSLDNLDSAPDPFEVHELLIDYDYNHIIYPSYSNGPDKVRWRVTAPAAGLTLDNWKAGINHLIGLLQQNGLNIKPVLENEILSQPWFITGPPDPEYRWEPLVYDRGQDYTIPEDHIHYELQYPVIEQDGKIAIHTGSELPKINPEQAQINLTYGEAIHPSAMALVTRGWSREKIVELVENGKARQRRSDKRIDRLVNGELTEMIEWVGKKEQAELEYDFSGLTCGGAKDTLNTVIDDVGLGLTIPPHLYEGVGWIGEGMSAMVAAGAANIAPYNFATVCAHLATAIGSNMLIDGTKPNLFIAKVGPTSTSKTSSDETISSVVRNFSNNHKFYGPDDFSSGVGLMRYLADNPRCLVVIDEATSLLRRPGQGDIVGVDKRNALLELYSAKDRYHKAYSNKANNIEIRNPCVSILGNATPTIFEDMDRRDFETGFMQRIDFYVYDGPAPYRINGNSSKLTDFVDRLNQLFNFDFQPDHPLYKNRNLTLLPEARAALNDHSTGTIDRVNSTDENWKRGMISRGYDLAVKYALIHHAATVPDCFDALLSVESVRWGVDVAQMVVDWKIVRLWNLTFENDFHRNCELFKEAIGACVKSGLPTTIKTMSNRRPKLRGLDTGAIDMIIKRLGAEGDIVVDKSKSPMSFHLVKE